MTVATISEGITVETVEPLCSSCFGAPVVVTSGTDLCGDCLDVECAINVYKDVYGVKPRGWSDADLVAWLREQPTEAAE